MSEMKEKMHTGDLYLPNDTEIYENLETGILILTE